MCACTDNGLVTPFNAKAAALLKGGGACTSPNHDTIYQPHLRVTTISLFSDFQHGPNDYLLWPQWHTQDYPFLTAIPSQETVPNHLLCMWQGVTRDNFIPLSGILTDGLRHLSQPRITEVMARWNEICSQVLEYKVKTKNPHIAVTAVDQSMYHTSKRFIGLPATLSQIQYFVAVFQWYFLELHAILDYLPIYEPCLNGFLPTATETAKTMGAFTDDACVVQDFFTAGLPVFFHLSSRPVQNTRLLFYPDCGYSMRVITSLHFFMFSSLPSYIQWWGYWLSKILCYPLFYTLMAGTTGAMQRPRHFIRFCILDFIKSNTTSNSRWVIPTTSWLQDLCNILFSSINVSRIWKTSEKKQVPKTKPTSSSADQVSGF